LSDSNEDVEKDKVEQLIESVWRRNILFDLTSKNYKYTQKKELEWMSVTSELNEDG